MGTAPTLPDKTIALGLVRIDEPRNCFVYYEPVTFPNAPEGSRAVCDMYLRRAAICGRIGADVESSYTVLALGPEGAHDVLDEWPIERKSARYLIEKLKMRVERG
jgi:hypothetical protein